MNSNDLIVNVGKNSNDTAALVWSVADDLVGAYKPHEYGSCYSADDSNQAVS